MLKPDQVPKEAIEAAAVMLSNGKTTAQAIAAALNAWPGFEYRADGAFPAFGYGPEAIVLPLPQEAGE